jgi:hypothetical protein
MADILLFKRPLIGTPIVEWCSKRSFAHKGDPGVYIELSGGRKVVLSPVSSSNL